MDLTIFANFLLVIVRINASEGRALPFVTQHKKLEYHCRNMVTPMECARCPNAANGAKQT